jgi:hypothetical protein
VPRLTSDTGLSGGGGEELLNHTVPGMCRQLALWERSGGKPDPLSPVPRCVSICSLAFSMDSMFLSASSNTETVHIFKLETVKEK